LIRQYSFITHLSFFSDNDDDDDDDDNEQLE